MIQLSSDCSLSVCCMFTGIGAKLCSLLYCTWSWSLLKSCHDQASWSPPPGRLLTKQCTCTLQLYLQMLESPWLLSDYVSSWWECTLSPHSAIFSLGAKLCQHHAVALELNVTLFYIFACVSKIALCLQSLPLCLALARLGFLKESLQWGQNGRMILYGGNRMK